MISVEHLTKYYGDVVAVDDLSFEIDEGHVYGFLGPNGAGKSTTMNIMTGCLSATAGSVKIDGYDIFEEAGEAKKRIGYLPEQPPLYMNESPVEYLRFVGEAKGLRGNILEEQVAEVIGQTKIGDVENRRISELSKGYRQRVGIAQALLGNPRVIILDEPTVGLDPIQIIEIRALIKELGQTHTVILSSHILSEVQAICDQILIIAKGKLMAFDEPQNLEKQLLTPNEIIITPDASEQEVRSMMDAVDHITDIRFDHEAEHAVAYIQTDFDDIYEISRQIFFAFSSAKKALLEMTLKKASLEDVFLELTEGGGSAEEVRAEGGDTKEETQPEGGGSAEEVWTEGGDTKEETQPEGDGPEEEVRAEGEVRTDVGSSEEETQTDAGGSEEETQSEGGGSKKKTRPYTGGQPNCPEDAESEVADE